MYFENLSKASQCRKEASRCFKNGRTELALRWIKVAKGFVRNSTLSRVTFIANGDLPLP